MAKKENKFIVVKIKDLQELQMYINCRGGNDGGRGDTSFDFASAERDIEGFNSILKMVNEDRKEPNKYVVINQDEPYVNGV